MRRYLDTEGTEEFINFILDLEETRFDETTSLYCKTVELRHESFIYLPALLLITNEETLNSILSKLRDLNLLADVEKEYFEDFTTFSCVIKNIKQQEQ